MINQQIGSTISALRRKQGLTQEQLADKLGVTNRSISRWENGVTAPDISMLQDLSRILNVSVGQLITGQADNSGDRTQACVQMTLELACRQREALRKKLNLRFGLALFWLLGGLLLPPISRMPQVLFCLCILLSGGFFLAAFWEVNKIPKVTKDSASVLSENTADLRMRSPQEMILFTQKCQKDPNNLQKKAFSRLCEELTDEEYAQFSFIAESCSFDGAPGPWHIAAMITNRRILLCGEMVRGRMMSQLVINEFPRKHLTKYALTRNALILQFPTQTLRLDGPSMDAVYQGLMALVP